MKEEEKEDRVQRLTMEVAFRAMMDGRLDVARDNVLALTPSYAARLRNVCTTLEQFVAMRKDQWEQNKTS